MKLMHSKIKLNDLNRHIDVGDQITIFNWSRMMESDCLIVQQILAKRLSCCQVLTVEIGFN